MKRYAEGGRREGPLLETGSREENRRPPRQPKARRAKKKGKKGTSDLPMQKKRKGGGWIC